MYEMVDEAKMARSSGSSRHDLFGKLLEASEGDMVGDRKLTDKELISNIFIFLFAGMQLFIPVTRVETLNLYSILQDMR